MTPFRSQGGRILKIRVRRPETGKPVTFSTGTPDETEAADVERAVRRWQGKDGRRFARPDVLAVLFAKRRTLAELYDASVDGTLDAVLRAVAQEDADRAAASRDPDLSRLVDVWAEAGANEKYVAQVRRLIPAGQPFPASQFRRKVVSEFLAGLENLRRTPDARGRRPAASNSTKNRHRAALSVFAWWLIEREVIDRNPVRDVKGYKAPRPRLVHYTPAQAMALVAAMPPGEPRFVAALMAGTALEWGAIAHGSRREFDGDDRTFHAFPWLEAVDGKTRYRSRIVAVTEDWTWPYIEAHLRTLAPNQRLVTIREKAMYDAHRRTAKALRLPAATLHDWRHTYAITAVKRGDDHQAIKRQLGHAPQSTLLYTTYGVYLSAPKRPRPEPPPPGPVTNSVTSDA